MGIEARMPQGTPLPDNEYLYKSLEQNGFAFFPVIHQSVIYGELLLPPEISAIHTGMFERFQVEGQTEDSVRVLYFVYDTKQVEAAVFDMDVHEQVQRGTTQIASLKNQGWHINQTTDTRFIAYRPKQQEPH